MKREPNLDLYSIKVRLAGITPGQWVDGNGYRVNLAVPDEDGQTTLFEMKHFPASTGYDAAFCAHAPDDIRALIDEVEWLQTQLHREHDMEQHDQGKPDHPLGEIETTPVELPDIKAALKPDERDPNGREAAPEADDQPAVDITLVDKTRTMDESATPDPSLVKKLPSFIDPPGFTEKYPAVPMESVDVYAAQQRKGHFSVSYDLWCGMWPAGAHKSTLDAEDAAIEAVHVGWTKTKTRGWCCPDHKIRPGT